MNLGNYGMLIFGTLVVWGCKFHPTQIEMYADDQLSIESDDVEST